MDGRRRKQQPVLKKMTQNPQTKIKELRKDIESLESEVNLLLEHVQVASIDSLCVVCKQPITTTEYHDMPCQHVICEDCGNTLIKKHRTINCPLCLQEQHLFHMRSTHSSSSSEDG